jgi:two-component system, NarL family, sensor histidine kinase UhpB
MNAPSRATAVPRAVPRKSRPVAASAPARAKRMQRIRLQEDERRRIARELHDEMGQLLAGLAMELAGLEAAVARGEQVTERFQQVRQLVEQIGREMRNLAFELRPSLLDDFGLIPAVQQSLEAWSARSGIRFELEVTGLTARLPVDLETAVYRVTQEAVTNVARHAQATVVTIAIKHCGAWIEIAIEDDGCGFDVDAVLTRQAASGSMGLRGIRERVALLDGDLEIRSRPGDGTRLRAIVPCGSSQPMPDADVSSLLSTPMVLELNALRAWSDQQRRELRETIARCQEISRQCRKLQEGWQERYREHFSAQPALQWPDRTTKH